MSFNKIIAFKRLDLSKKDQMSWFACGTSLLAVVSKYPSLKQLDLSGRSETFSVPRLFYKGQLRELPSKCVPHTSLEELDLSYGQTDLAALYDLDHWFPRLKQVNFNGLYVMYLEELQECLRQLIEYIKNKTLTDPLLQEILDKFYEHFPCEISLVVKKYIKNERELKSLLLNVRGCEAPKLFGLDSSIAITPFTLAVYFDNLPTVELLLANGADSKARMRKPKHRPDEEDSPIKFPIDFAQSPEMESLLQRYL
jgi:hypothetical protein